MSVAVRSRAPPSHSSFSSSFSDTIRHHPPFRSPTSLPRPGRVEAPGLHSKLDDRDGTARPPAQFRSGEHALLANPLHHYNYNHLGRTTRAKLWNLDGPPALLDRASLYSRLPIPQLPRIPQELRDSIKLNPRISRRPPSRSRSRRMARTRLRWTTPKIQMP